MENNLLFYSSSPHIRHPRSTKKIMIHVCIALMPALIMGVVYFGLKALLYVALSSIAAVLSEYVYVLISGKSTKQFLYDFDFSSLVTGLLIGLTIGTNYPWYAPILGSIFAIIVVKMLFGGTGKNIVNPAITGRIFIFMSFQSIGAWALPNIASISNGSIETGATILEGFLNGTIPNLSNWDLFLGTGLAGCIGETCKVALLLGGVYLAIMGIINLGYPIIYIAVTGLFSVALNNFNFNFFLPSILSGGLIIGAIFMATDYTTTPNTKLGNIIYFICLGLLTSGLRQATKMEVVSFVILLMNLIVPLIDKFIINKPFGYKRKR